MAIFRHRGDGVQHDRTHSQRTQLQSPGTHLRSWNLTPDVLTDMPYTKQPTPHPLLLSSIGPWHLVQLIPSKGKGETTHECNVRRGGWIECSSSIKAQPQRVRNWCMMLFPGAAPACLKLPTLTSSQNSAVREGWCILSSLAPLSHLSGNLHRFIKARRRREKGKDRSTPPHQEPPASSS